MSAMATPRQTFERFGADAFDYDPTTGLFRHKVAGPDRIADDRARGSWNARWSGTKAGCVRVGRYNYRCMVLTLCAHSVLAHQYAWFLTHGCWPDAIDHINGDATDNSISNLREADASDNAKNCKLRRTNTSGRVGVQWRANRNKWAAGMHSRGQYIWLGHFDTFEAACAARTEAEAQHGFGPNHGRSQTSASAVLAA